MVFILVILLLVSVAGVVGLGAYCGQLHERVSQFRNDAAQHHALTQKYNADVQKLNEYAVKLQNENQHLAKWRGIANADAKAGEMLQTAKSNIERAAVEAKRLVVTATERASAVQVDAEQRATAEISAAAEAAKRTLAEAKEKA